MGRQSNPRTRRAPAAPTRIREAEVLRWAHGGEGVVVHAETDTGPGRVVFVPDVVPGDVVDLIVVEAKERWARARVERLVRPSPERVQVPCAVQDRCGGCPWMAGSARAQAASRRAILEGELHKRLGWSGPVTLVEAPAAFGYRQRVRLTWRSDARGVRLGFLGKRSHDLVDITRCPIADPRIEAALPEVRALAAGTHGEGRVTLLAGEDGVAGAFDDGRRFGPDAVTLRFGDHAQRLSPEAFTQANAAVTGELLAILERWARAAPHRDKPAIELFAGGGTLTMALWRAGWTVVAYEVAEAARAAFEATRDAHGVAPERGRWHACDLSIGVPLPAPAEPSLIVLDPPRTGAAALMPWVKAAGATTIVYVSCDLATGLRDVASLLDRYALREVVGLDMFPHAGHQEVMLLVTLR